MKTKKRTTLNQSFWKDPEQVAQENQLKDTLRSLKFNNLEEYYRWCESHRLEKTLTKRNYQLREEQQIREAELKAEAERNDKLRRQELAKNPVIKSLLKKIDSSCEINPTLGLTWEEMKKHLRHSCVFCETPLAVSALTNNVFFVSAYFKLAQFHDLFIRPVQDLKIKKSNPEAYFQETVNRLICRYPVPRALMGWWFKMEAKWAQGYVDLAQGRKLYEVFKSVETIPLTHRQINLLMTKYAKGTSSYARARLQAILASLKAPGKLESSINRSDIFLEDLGLNYSLKYEYLSFLVKNANFFDWNRTLDLWDYVMHLRGGAGASFSFKDRSLMNLIEGMHAWHADLGLSKKLVDDKRVWEKTGIKDYNFLNEKTTEEYSITELTSGRAIHAEGKIMHHCVYSYVARCESKGTAIFSMKHKPNVGQDWKSVGTIEVDLRRGQVVQFKAKYNAAPESGAQFHLRKWADRENIKV